MRRALAPKASKWVTPLPVARAAPARCADDEMEGEPTAVMPAPLLNSLMELSSRDGSPQDRAPRFEVTEELDVVGSALRGAHQ
jgi:hypothetical protein